MIKLITKLESHIDKKDFKNLEISKSSVGWHLDHSLKVINKVSQALQASDPKDYKNNFSFLGKVFFTLGFFPRGKAKAPKHVIPPETISKEDLISQVELAKSNIIAIESLDKNAHFKHPMFGNINAKRVSKFLALHTNHHLKIVSDIVKKG